MRRRSVWVSAVVTLIVLSMGAAGCDQVPGRVTGRDKDCLPGSTDEKPLCTYQIKTEKGYFEVIKDVYERCLVGEKYPQCGDKPNEWVPA